MASRVPFPPRAPRTAPRGGLAPRRGPASLRATPRESHDSRGRQPGPAAFPRFQSLGPQRERRASARRSSASINKQTRRPGSATTPRDGTAPPRSQPAPAAAAPLKVVWLRRGRRNSRPPPPCRGQRTAATALASPGSGGRGAPGARSGGGRAGIQPQMAPLPARAGHAALGGCRRLPGESPPRRRAGAREPRPCQERPPSAALGRGAVAAAAAVRAVCAELRPRPCPAGNRVHLPGRGAAPRRPTGTGGTYGTA